MIPETWQTIFVQATPSFSIFVLGAAMGVMINRWRKREQLLKASDFGRAFEITYSIALVPLVLFSDEILKWFGITGSSAQTLFFLFLGVFYVFGPVLLRKIFKAST
jgi:hypothetical protein